MNNESRADFIIATLFLVWCVVIISLTVYYCNSVAEKEMESANIQEEVKVSDEDGLSHEAVRTNKGKEVKVSDENDSSCKAVRMVKGKEVLVKYDKDYYRLKYIGINERTVRKESEILFRYDGEILGGKLIAVIE